MPFTFTVSPAVVRDARSYAAATGTTLEAMILAYVEAVAKRARARSTRPRPAFLDVNRRITEEGASELLAAQGDFERIDEDMWK